MTRKTEKMLFHARDIENEKEDIYYKSNRCFKKYIILKTRSGKENNMRKVKKIVIFLMSAMMLFGSIETSVLAAESEKAKEVQETNVHKVKIYDSTGNLIDELDSKEKLDEYFTDSKERGPIKKKIIEFLVKVGEAWAVQYAADGIDNVIQYLANYKITIPKVEPGDIVTVYSNDGNIYDPYPPNSYQSVTWRKTNFVVAVS